MMVMGFVKVIAVFLGEIFACFEWALVHLVIYPGLLVLFG